MLRKIYKNKRLEFRQSAYDPYFYMGYQENGKLFEEMIEGWGWSIAIFSKEQLETLSDW